MKPGWTRAIYPQPLGRGTGHAPGAPLVSPARFAGMAAVAFTGMRNRFAAGDLTTAALIDQIVARVLT
jgi:hypothetical protein